METEAAASIQNDLQSEEENQNKKYQGRLFLYFSWIAISLCWVMTLVLFILWIVKPEIIKDDDDLLGDIWEPLVFTTIGCTLCMGFITRICFEKQLVGCIERCMGGCKKLLGEKGG